MSKKSKRAKLPRPMKQLQQRSLVPSQVHEQLVSRVEYAKQQMVKGDLAGCISTCEPLLNALPKGSKRYREVLVLLGVAHGMLRHYQESYAIFTEAITLDPAMAELWYNRAMASRCTGRIGQAVQDLERAVELSKNDPSEVARKFVAELKTYQQELQKAMQNHGADTTFEQFLEREERFIEAMDLARQEKWQEAEPMFRQLAEEANRVPQYWGNLGVSLMMQRRYDEAEAALKQALAIDPGYAIARGNLKQLPKLRHARRHQEVEVRELSPSEHVKQSLEIYQRDEEGSSPIRIEAPSKPTLTDRLRQIGKNPHV